MKGHKPALQRMSEASRNEALPPRLRDIAGRLARDLKRGRDTFGHRVTEKQADRIWAASVRREYGV